MDRPLPTVRIKVVFDDDARLGPGKIDLLQRVGETGSISAAGRALGMSYRRAWLLIDALNTMFDEPCVRASAGGAHGGGASLTPFGEKLVAAYRHLEQGTQVRARAAFRDIAPKPGVKGAEAD